MPKRPSRKKSSRPPPAGRSGTTAKATKRAQPSTRPLAPQLLYKVVELSTVDEHHLEQTINEWVPKGWTLDGVQFAMRESSKRPSMAFVFFTREGVAAEVTPRGELEESSGGAGTDDEVSASDDSDARERLHRLAGGPAPSPIKAPRGHGGALAPVPSVAKPDPHERAYDAGGLQPYREFDADDLERLSSTDHLPRETDMDERTWPDRPERANDPWARLHALANAPDDESDDSDDTSDNEGSDS